MSYDGAVGSCRTLLLLLTGCGFEVTAVPGGGPGAGEDAGAPDVPADADVADAPGVPPGDAPADAPAAPITEDFPITQDTYVDSLYPSSLLGSSVAMLADGGGQRAVALWRADLSAIPPTASIDAVDLHVYTSNTTGDVTTIYAMLEAWDESTAHWTQRSTGNAWSGVGAAPPSRGTTAYGTISVTTPLTSYVAPVEPALIAGWVSDPASNLGAALVVTGSNGTAFRTRDDVVASRRPYLRITYRP